MEESSRVDVGRAASDKNSEGEGEEKAELGDLIYLVRLEEPSGIKLLV
jgi:hypothetical protein